MPEDDLGMYPTTYLWMPGLHVTHNKIACTPNSSNMGKVGLPQFLPQIVTVGELGHKRALAGVSCSTDR
jgi:hypothetical protein